MIVEEKKYCVNCGVYVWGKVKEYSLLHHKVLLCYACQQLYKHNNR